MLALKFNVNGQELTFDPKCDLDDLMPGSKNQIRAEFTFSKEWANTSKVAAFYSRLGHEYQPQHLKDGKTCIIPVEALKKRFFKVKVIAQNGLMTNKLTIDQKGGNT